MQAACDLCHRRKSRCDKAKPTCGLCVKSSVECIYSDRSRDPSIRKEHVEGMERRLRQVEAKNKALSSELARLRSTSVSEAQASPTAAEESFQHSSTTQDVSSGDVINEVSFLASTAAGERHYLGSASGVMLANLFGARASVDIAPAPQHQISSPRIGLQRSNTTTPTSRKASPKDSLPPKELVTELFDNYFAHDHLCYPFLLPSSTLPIIEAIYDEPSFYSENAFEGFVFDMILAIATVNVYKFDWQMLPSAETHHARAMHRVTEVFQTGGIKSLQAILLLCQYRTSSSLQDTSASMWHLVGIAVRIAYELGLHRESTYTVKNGEPADENDFERSKNQEIRRRCFWSVFAFDRIVSITLGRPLALHMEDVDVDLPSVKNDFIINSEFECGVNSQFNRTSIFVHILKCRLICGKIMRVLHGPKRTDHSDSTRRRLRDELASELGEWQLKTGELNLPESPPFSSISQTPSSFRSKEWYEVLYSNAMLMLFRPSPNLSDISGDSDTLQKLFLSSRRAILIYASLHRSRKINYSWITLHSVFMAGLTYLYALSRYLRAWRVYLVVGVVLELDPTPIEIVNDTRACSKVLVAVSERRNALRRCHEVFDKLSDAILNDAIKLQCSPPTSLRSSNAHPHSTREHLDSVQPVTSISSIIARPDSFQEPGTVRGQHNSWADIGFTTPTPALNTGVSPLAIDSEFRSCFGDLQDFYSGTYAGDPVMDLSQDWLDYIDGYENTQPLSHGFTGQEFRY